MEEKVNQLKKELSELYYNAYSRAIDDWEDDSIEVFEDGFIKCARIFLAHEELVELQNSAFKRYEENQ